MAYRRVRLEASSVDVCVMTKPKEETTPPASILAGSYDVGFGLRRLLAGADPGGQVMSVASLQSTVRERLASQVESDVGHRARWRPRRRSVIV
jgi:hypothetical protein